MNCFVFGNEKYLVDIGKLWFGNSEYNMSCIIRKPDFCLCENKGADQLCSNCTADQRLCFCYSDSTILHLLIA